MYSLLKRMGYDTKTSVEDVLPDKSESQEIYNMIGQKLSEPAPGINIINGRKVIIR